MFKIQASFLSQPGFSSCYKKQHRTRGIFSVSSLWLCFLSAPVPSRPSLSWDPPRFGKRKEREAMSRRGQGSLLSGQDLDLTPFIQHFHSEMSPLINSNYKPSDQHNLLLLSLVNLGTETFKIQATKIQVAQAI